VALAVIAEFLADLESGNVRHGQFLATIATALKDGANQVFVLPGKPSKKDRGVRALLGSKGPLHGAMEMLGGVESRYFAQPGAFGFEALLDFGIILNLDEIRRHKFLRR
jgi:hypothetical protein